jgi:hypothetical protein
VKSLRQRNNRQSRNDKVRNPMRWIFVIILSVISTLGVGNNIVNGAYPGEFYTNSFEWVTGIETMMYGMAYSPDGGRTLDITVTSDLRLLYGDLLPLAAPGLCYLHHYNQNGNELLIMQNWGRYFSTIALSFGFFEIVQSGFVQNQIFIIDYDQDTQSSTLYRSDQAGNEAYVICDFDSTKVTAINMGVNTGEIFLTAYDYRDNLVHILYSSNMGSSFTDYPFPEEIMIPFPVDIGAYKIYPQSNGRLYISRYTNTSPRVFKLYRCENINQEFSLVWERNLLTNEWIYLVPVFDNDIDFIVQKRYHWMSYNELAFFTSNDEGITLVPTGSYQLDGTYVTPAYLVPVSDDNPISATATSSIVHVRTNGEWSVTIESDWIHNINQISGAGHADITLSFNSNLTGADRFASLNFHSNTAQDTIFVITQSGSVSCSDDINIVNPASSLSCYPNPSRYETTIKYHLANKCNTRLDVYNVKGQLVKRLADHTKVPGNYTVVWDGKDECGQPVSSGVYIYRLTTPQGSWSSKLLMLK